jgi:hypothetical protein
MTQTLLIGYAQEIVTPSLARPVFLAGLDNNRTALSVHDDLFARALALHCGDTHLVLVALDLIGFFRPHVQEVARRIQEGFPRAQVMIACTHVHHGPDTMGMWGRGALRSGVDPLYMAELKDKITRAALGALAQADPAELRCTSLEVKGLAKNPRNPQVLDQELTCLQFAAPGGGTALATLLIYPCHPEVLWFGSRIITSDYPGFLRPEFEAHTGAPCLFFSGALGGMMTPDVTQHSFAEAETMGKTLARAALGALEKKPALPVDSLAYKNLEYAIPLTNPLFKLGMLLGTLPKRPRPKGSMLTEAGLLRIGDAWLACVPGEALPALGMQIKARLKLHGAGTAGVIGLANDETGYILPEADFVFPRNPFKPGDHYEETNSIGAQAAPRLLEALEKLLAG